MTVVAASKPRKRWIAPIIALVLIVGGGAVVYQRFFATYHLATVREGVLYRDGSRSPREFARTLEKVHPKTVVSLVDEQEAADPSKPQFTKENDIAASHGARVERIAVTLGGWPKSEDLQKFLSIARDDNNQPVLVHCAQGVRRTAMFVAAYQQSVLGYTKQQAKDAILSFGHSDSTINDIKRFIDEYDPKNETVPDLRKAAAN